MKFLLLTAAVVAVAVAVPTQRFAHIGPDFVDHSPIQVEPEVVDEYNPIHVGPEIIDEYHPIHVGPEIIDEYNPIHVGPEIIDEYHPIHVGPEIIDEYHPIHVGPELVEEESPISVGPVLVDPPAASGSPLVQIIVNINKDGQVVGVPEMIETPVHLPELVDFEEVPVDAVELPPAVLPEMPVISKPESLN